MPSAERLNPFVWLCFVTIDFLAQTGGLNLRDGRDVS